MRYLTGVVFEGGKKPKEFIDIDKVLKQVTIGTLMLKQKVPLNTPGSMRRTAHWRLSQSF